MNLYEIASVSLRKGLEGDTLRQAQQDPEIGQYIDDPTQYDTIMVGDTPVGTISVRGDYVKSVFVSPQHRGQGVGERAIDAALQGSGSAHVDITNKASVQMFTKLGFKPVGEPTKDGDALVQEYRR